MYLNIAIGITSLTIGVLATILICRKIYKPYLPVNYAILSKHRSQNAMSEFDTVHSENCVQTDDLIKMIPRIAEGPFHIRFVDYTGNYHWVTDAQIETEGSGAALTLYNLDPYDYEDNGKRKRPCC